MENLKQILENFVILHQNLGLIIVFIGFVITNVFPIMFIVYPDIFIFIGIFLAAKFFPWWIVWIILVVGALIGETISYFIGFKFSNKFLAHKIMQKKQIKKFIDNLYKHPTKYFVIGKFIPGLVRIAPFLAGLIKMDFVKFLILDILMIIYGISYFFLVWLVGFSVLKYFLGQWAWYVFAAVILIYIGYEIFKRRKNL